MFSGYLLAVMEQSNASDGEDKFFEHSSETAEHSSETAYKTATHHLLLAGQQYSNGLIYESSSSGISSHAQMLFTFLSFSISDIIKSKHSWVLLTYSVLGQKEFRFVMPIAPTSFDVFWMNNLMLQMVRELF
ncbi:GPI mannosyltransferase 3-like isoform X2 [Tripterygium wilfordii]|uniref:GPI mannosyltransferase 3-like isoform X2 n=1 Tax=Tripterygium wilfordii TaxID=458696 RepID=A0A7J7BVI0_TRIWF|nr:GPI mannosyltransferase 3-like isoform X2 [Tripterygium wilfordii]